MAQSRRTRRLAAIQKIFFGLGALVFALVVTLFAIAVALVGTVAALSIACFVALLPLGLFLALAAWGWWVDRVWMRVEVDEPDHTFTLTFPVPLSLLRLVGHVDIITHGRPRSMRLSDLPWKDLRTVLQEEALTVDIIDAADRSRVHFTIGPRKQVVDRRGPLAITWSSRKA